MLSKAVEASAKEMVKGKLGKSELKDAGKKINDFQESERPQESDNLPYENDTTEISDEDMERPIYDDELPEDSENCPQLGDLHEPYKSYMENGEYDSVEEMCNDLEVNEYDVYYTEDEFEDNDSEEDDYEQCQNEVSETSGLIKNKEDGLAREKEVQEELEKQYPPEQGYQIVSEVYLRDENGNIVKDPETGEARRIDFVVVKDGKVVDSIEVTSTTADKTAQTAKENRIRANGGNYIKDNDGNLVKIPSDVITRIERRA